MTKKTAVEALRSSPRILVFELVSFELVSFYVFRFVLGLTNLNAIKFINSID
jgi:hypothetical protein